MTDICTANLKPNDKRILFEGIKVKRPALAEMMAKDAFVQGLKNQFGASFCFSREEYDRLYQAGLEIVNNKQGNL